jgi:hypothetical protein
MVWGMTENTLVLWRCVEGELWCPQLTSVYGQVHMQKEKYEQLLDGGGGTWEISFFWCVFGSAPRAQRLLGPVKAVVRWVKAVMLRSRGSPAPLVPLDNNALCYSCPCWVQHPPPSTGCPLL